MITFVVCWLVASIIVSAGIARCAHLTKQGDAR